jgi:hypothetical protein
MSSKEKKVHNIWLCKSLSNSYVEQLKKKQFSYRSPRVTPIILFRISGMGVETISLRLLIKSCRDLVQTQSL